MAEPRYSKSNSVNEVRDKTKRQTQARKKAREEAARKAERDREYNQFRTKTNSRYESKQRANATKKKKQDDAYNQFRTKTNSRYESKRKAEATRKQKAANDFYSKVNKDYKKKQAKEKADKKAKAKNFYDKVNSDYEKKQKANKSRDWERFKAKQDAFKRKQMLKRDVKSFVKNTPGKVKRGVLNSPTPSNRPDYQSMQSVRTGKERNGVKYIDKVKTKSGKIRYIYSKNNQGGGTRKSSPLDQAKRMASGAAKRLTKLSNRAKNAGSNFLKSIFK